MTPDILWRNKVIGVGFGKITLKVCIPDHVRQVRASSGMTQKRLGEEKNELHKGK
jgi:hypothetical protein